MRTVHKRYLKMAAGYIDEGLRPAAKKTFERHLARCPWCRQAVDEMRTMRGIIASQGTAPVPPFFMTRHHAALSGRSPMFNPWEYEAKRLLPVFGLLAALLSLLLFFTMESGSGAGDEYYLPAATRMESRVLIQRESFTGEEVLALAVTDERK